MSAKIKEYATKEDVKEIVSEAVEGLARLISTTCATKEDLIEVKAEVRTIKGDIIGMKKDIVVIKEDIGGMKKDMKRFETKLDFFIEDHEITKTRVTHLEKGMVLMERKKI